MAYIVVTGSGIAGRMGVKGPDDSGSEGLGHVPDTFHAAVREFVRVAPVALVLGKDQFECSVTSRFPQDDPADFPISIQAGGPGLALEAEAFLLGEPVGGPGPVPGEIGIIPGSGLVPQEETSKGMARKRNTLPVTRQ